MVESEWQRDQALLMQQMMEGGLEMSHAFASMTHHSQGQIAHLQDLLVGLQNAREKEQVDLRNRVIEMLRHQEKEHERQANEFINAQKESYENLIQQQRQILTQTSIEAGSSQLTIVDQRANLSRLKTEAEQVVNQ